jgi:hypothetical protein
MSTQPTSIKLTIEQRKMILQLMNYSYKIPEEYHNCVAEAIKKYATRQYTDDKIREMVQKSQSVANSGYLLREDSISLFRGKFAEWLACIEYNAMKNSGSVIMTIVNPDEFSKADLLHFIKVGDEFKAIAGPDIKSGGSTYVFNQWKKIVTSRYDIPMVDFDGILTTEEGLKQLTKRERQEFELLCEKYPRKRPLPSAWSNQDELRLRVDYFKNLLETEGAFTYSPEIAGLLKTALANQNADVLPQSDWSDFNKKCKEIFQDFNPVLESKYENTKQEFNQSQEELSQNSPKTVKKIRVPKIPSTNVGSTLLKVVALGAAAVVVGTVAKNPQAAKKIAANIGKTLIKTPVSTKTVENVATNTVKNSLGGTHASPVLHKVSGYVRSNGTKVASYMRGIRK